MLTDAQVTAAVRALDDAERTRVQAGLLSQAHAGMDMRDAYRIQQAWVSGKVAGGDPVAGWKIGLTSRAMQLALGIDIPDSGYLLESMRIEPGQSVAADRFIAPRVEAELAFVMKNDVDPGASVFDILNATDYIVPALEILDTRIVRQDPVTGRRRDVCDTIADNAANAGFMLGGRPVRPDALDLRWLGAIVSVNGQVEETGLGGGVLNHPAQGLVWLARRLADNGHRIRAGQVVLSGSFIRPVECPPGTTVCAEFGALGTLTCHFAAQETAACPRP